MDTPTLVLILVVVATFVVFGPRPKFNRRTQAPKPVKVKRVERVSSLAPLYVPTMQGEYRSTHAAARATSPMRQRAQAQAPQFAVADQDGAGWRGAPLPHELPSQGASMLEGHLS